MLNNTTQADTKLNIDTKAERQPTTVEQKDLVTSSISDKISSQNQKIVNLLKGILNSESYINTIICNPEEASTALSTINEQLDNLIKEIRLIRDNEGIFMTENEGVVLPKSHIILITEILERQMELSIWATSGSIDNNARSILNQEFQGLKEAFANIMGHFKFINTNILDSQVLNLIREPEIFPENQKIIDLLNEIINSDNYSIDNVTTAEQASKALVHIKELYKSIIEELKTVESDKEGGASENEGEELTFNPIINIIGILERQMHLSSLATSGSLNNNARIYLNQEFQGLKDNLSRIVEKNHLENIKIFNSSLFSFIADKEDVELSIIDNNTLKASNAADGALDAICEILARQSEIASLVASKELDDNERQFLNSKFHDLVEEIDRIAEATNFNTIKMINGNLDKAAGVILIKEKVCNDAYNETLEAVQYTDSPIMQEMGENVNHQNIV
ncbi:MAG: flagellin domain protein [Rickettsiaceae bacterium]|jgi:flagellin-like hook-associated protein FlgL|nr:flagellin domain protein [Rickettsiaceae bacterium]